MLIEIVSCFGLPMGMGTHQKCMHMVGYQTVPKIHVELH